VTDGEEDGEEVVEKEEEAWGIALPPSPILVTMVEDSESRERKRERGSQKRISKETP